jgi:hypothetical protein
MWTGGGWDWVIAGALYDLRACRPVASDARAGGARPS